MSKNRLAGEKSPYLLQHAENPVDWYPWGDEAFTKARTENRPVFLSIGYSTCHWCHVMEKESFEDREVARLMNETFVSIKVDREERPDLDGMYMTAAQLMTGAGGWPLNIILTPDKKPFYAATYIPKGGRPGITGMLEIVPQIKKIWEKRQEEVLLSANQVASAIREASRETSGEELDEGVLKTAYDQLVERFDFDHGGFSRAPKFPTPHNLTFLLRYWRRTGNGNALEMVDKTLREMRMGGIYDHVGFGFHRYSTDRKWLVPHYEKMLYDQALLAMAYTEAFQATGEGLFGRTAQEVFAYVLRDMTSPEGGFYSGEDADSEGKEGKFYLWTEKEIRAVLENGKAKLALRLFNVEAEGNFIEPGTDVMTGGNILHIRRPFADIAREFDLTVNELMEITEAIRRKLFAVREKRVHPMKDDKILTDWNGLMIAALAKGARVFDRPELAVAARKGAEFILRTMRQPDGSLLHRFREGEASINGFLDDYAFFVWGLLELYETTFDAGYLQAARELNRYLIEHFWDENAGGFFFTPDNGESVIARRKEIYDGAIPSGNSVAMLNLIRLAGITSDQDLEEKARMIGRTFSKEVKQAPSAYTQLMSAVDFATSPPCRIVIAGNSGADDVKEMLAALNRPFVPDKLIILRPTEQEEPDIVHLAADTKDAVQIGGKATAYICRAYSCRQPTNDIKEMMESILAKP